VPPSFQDQDLATDFHPMEDTEDMEGAILQLAPQRAAVREDTKGDTDILDTVAMEDSAEDMAVAISSSTISSATTTTTDLPATEAIHSADELGKNNE